MFSTEYLLNPALIDGASRSVLFVYGRGETFGAVNYVCTRQ
jgi:hypothetical protein